MSVRLTRCPFFTTTFRVVGDSVSVIILVAFAVAVIAGLFATAYRRRHSHFARPPSQSLSYACLAFPIAAVSFGIWGRVAPSSRQETSTSDPHARVLTTTSEARRSVTSSPHKLPAPSPYKRHNCLLSWRQQRGSMSSVPPEICLPPRLAIVARKNVKRSR
jgi:hypothetical protein